ncbi:hypothetical protein [Bifidobacterium tissieri]|uniref:Uncharacterized protein n=1 Tax=Bifidobacterium tissieri TaxID=1630162 RepID=A0A5M9ZMG3_9BIFI|nr:hypothetical protein [Bifidobacterium tissieri]KAA8828665.1 hypothetical protein EM849_11550 [Bifidobacterium tissieri]KAA8831608.1 hypothetical protein EMO89_02465 [Bifidobacterium tissieri]
MTNNTEHWDQGALIRSLIKALNTYAKYPMFSKRRGLYTVSDDDMADIARTLETTYRQETNQLTPPQPPTRPLGTIIRYRVAGVNAADHAVTLVYPTRKEAEQFVKTHRGEYSITPLYVTGYQTKEAE